MDERIKRTKDKLRVYGSYSREISKLRVWLLDLKTYLWLQSPRRSLSHSGRRNIRMHIRGLDNKHPPGQQLCVQKAAIEAQLEQLRAARSALGLDDWLDSLSMEDRQIVQLVYEEGYSYQAAAPMVNMSKTGLQYRIDQICKSPYAYG